MSHPEGKLRFRLFIGGELADETWLIDPAHADATARRHRATVDATDQPWMLEVYDPDQPPDEAYLRIGSDTAGMWQPVPFDWLPS